MTLLVRDEEDVLAANLDHHFAHGVDFVVATDNLSEDATPDILEHYAKQGRLAWRRETDDDYAQAAWVTRMAREAATEHGADWVVNSDADEFWWAIEVPLRLYLEQLPDEVGGIKAERYNFLPLPEDDQDEPFHERMIVREVVSLSDRGRRILPKVAHRADPDIEVEQGNHGASGPRIGDVVPTDAIEILHFPMRSYRQFENKIVKGGRAYAQNPDRERYGKIWQQLYQRQLAGELPDYYATKTVPPDQVAEGLREGRYVEDRRLRDHLRALAGR